MKIIITIFNYFPQGGLQRDFLEITHGLIDAGHDVEVFTQSWQGEMPRFPVNILPQKALTNHQQNLSFVKQFQCIIRESDHDIVLGFNKMPGLDYYFAGDLCFKGQDTTYLQRCFPRYKVYHQLEDAIFSKESITKILVLTEQQKSSYQACYNTSDDRFLLLPPIIEHDFLQGLQGVKANPHSTKEKHRQYCLSLFSLKDEPIILLMVASHFKTKGVDRTIDALSKLPGSLKDKICLLIVGGDDPARLQRQANKGGLQHQIHFVGTQEDLIPFYVGADLFIHPARKEAGGKVILEAMAAGLPVITTDVCGYAPHLQASQGGAVMASPYDEEHLVNTLQHVLANQCHWPEWSQLNLDYLNQKQFSSMPDAAVKWISSCENALC